MTRRFSIGRYELHCGSVFDIQIGGQWVALTLEHSINADGNFYGWYITDGVINIKRLIGRKARFEP